MKTKTLYLPPLPFLGCKRDFVKPFLSLLLEAEHQGYITKDTIFLDVFGGSGILSHNIKRMFPNNRVIWNDFDSYQVRLDNLENTNELLKRINNAVDYKKEFQRLSENEKKEVIAIIENEQQANGYIDFITISAYLLFQNNYASSIDELKTHTLYRKHGDLDLKHRTKEGYLKDVERISCDFTEAMNTFNSDNVFSIYDPPYLFSNETSYSSKWSVRNFLILLSLAKPPYVFFSHKRSGILDFMECFNGFENVKIITRERRLTQTSLYNEYMIVQYTPPPPPTISKEEMGTRTRTLNLNLKG